MCTLLTSDNVPGVGHLNRKNDLSSNPPPMPGLPPLQLNIDRCITSAAWIDFFHQESKVKVSVLFTENR